MRPSTLCLFVLFFVLLQVSAVAQPAEELIKVRSGTGLGNFPQGGRFRFAEFTKGSIYSASKKTWSIDRLNYDFYLAQMVSINEKGDTLIVKDLPEFRYFKIGSSVFIHIHNKGYYEVLEDAEVMKLCVNEIYRMKRKERHLNNGYGDFNDQTSAYNSGVKSDIVLEKKHLYYLADKDDNFMKADRSHFQKAFPTYKLEIKLFTQSHKTNFRVRKDVEALFEYCTHLGS